MQNNDRKMISIFERFLSVWVLLCIIAGILLGKFAADVASYQEAIGAPLDMILKIL